MTAAPTGLGRPLETPRLVLRPVVRADWRAIHRYMADPDVTRWLPEGRLDAEGSRAFARQQSGPGATAAAVVERASGELIGHMPYHPWFEPETQEIGWVIAADRQGRGYGAEAARALLDHAFSVLGRHRVIATCQPENPASWRIMEKLGMRREAHFRRALHRPDGAWWDEYFYAILAEEYRARAPT